MTPTENYLFWTAAVVLFVYVASTVYRFWKDAIKQRYYSRYPGYAAMTVVLIAAFGLLTFSHSTYVPPSHSLTPVQTVRTDFVKQVEADNQAVKPQTKSELKQERRRRSIEEEDAGSTQEAARDQATQKSIKNFRKELLKDRQ